MSEQVAFIIMAENNKTKDDDTLKLKTILEPEGETVEEKEERLRYNANLRNRKYMIGLKRNDPEKYQQQLALQKKFREENPDYYLEYEEKNKERLLEYRKNYRLTNLDRLKARRRKYYQDNKEAEKQKMKEWKLANPEKVKLARDKQKRKRQLARKIAREKKLKTKELTEELISSCNQPNEKEENMAKKCNNCKEILNDDTRDVCEDCIRKVILGNKG